MNATKKKLRKTTGRIGSKSDYKKKHSGKFGKSSKLMTRTYGNQENRRNRGNNVSKKSNKTIQKPKIDTSDPDFLTMLADINDYKKKLSNNNDILKFENYLNQSDSEDELAASNYVAPVPKPDLTKMDMKDAMKYMTKEERQAYLSKKQKRKKKKFEKEINKHNKFKPKINLKSKAIDNNRTKHMKFHRHDLLHGLGIVLKQREDQLREIIQAEQSVNQNEWGECTFKPRLNRTGPCITSFGSIADRTKALMQRKQAKKEKQKKLQEMDEVKDCTFTPKINYKIHGGKSVMNKK